MDRRDNDPNRKKVCTVTAHEQQGQTARFTFKENGAKVTRADLIYTKNGGDKDEEWFRAPANLKSDSEVSANIPNGTTHYILNLIDENQFLRSYPEVGSRKAPFADHAIKAQRASPSNPL